MIAKRVTVLLLLLCCCTLACLGQEVSYADRPGQSLNAHVVGSSTLYFETGVGMIRPRSALPPNVFFNAGVLRYGVSPKLEVRAEYEQLLSPGNEFIGRYYEFGTLGVGAKYQLTEAVPTLSVVGQFRHSNFASPLGFPPNSTVMGALLLEVPLGERWGLTSNLGGQVAFPQSNTTAWLTANFSAGLSPHLSLFLEGVATYDVGNRLGARCNGGAAYRWGRFQVDAAMGLEANNAYLEVGGAVAFAR